MPSPFPGMDPYIEGWIWGDFHSRINGAICEELNPRLPKRYIALTDLFIRRVETSTLDETILGKLDVFLSDRHGRSQSGTAVVAAPAPHISVLPGVVVKQHFVKIIDNRGRRIVTVIELLSPANKSGGKDSEVYRFKRNEYIGGSINLVEIDLLRRGQRPPVGEPSPPQSDYVIAVHDGQDRGRFGIWPFSVREPIPIVPVPLDPDEAFVTLDLRKCLDRVYDGGRYGDQLDYRRPPDHALAEPDATWARELLTAQLKTNGTGA
jgi:hypothetical protein